MAGHGRRGAGPGVPDGAVSVLSRRRALARWVPALALASALWLLSDRPGDALPSIGADKFAHALAWAALGYAVRWAHVGRGGARVDGASWAVAVAYGVIDEVHQAFVPGRVPSPADVAADAVGAAAGVLLAAWHARRVRRSQR